MKNFISLCTGLILCTFVSAQNKIGKISGSVNDETNKPLSSVSVSLLKLKDSSLVKISVTNKDGKYKFESIAVGNYFVSATLVGYQKKTAPFLKSLNRHVSFLLNHFNYPLLQKI